jgi:polyhydroxyalkanoate synthesis regulator phasin
VTREPTQTDEPTREDADEPIARDDSAQDAVQQQPLAPLLERGRADELHTRWRELQSKFVDDPRVTVEQADALVDELLKDIARGFADARAQLERQWTQGDDASTEHLRLTLQRYRSFFERLLSV